MSIQRKAPASRTCAIPGGRRRSATAVSAAILSLVLVSVTCLIPAIPASATIGGRLLSSSPVAGSRLSSAPTRIRLQFNLPLTDDTWVRVTGSKGVVIARRPQLLVGLAVLALPDVLPNGNYIVDYNADFGLLGSTRGTVPFAVGPAPRATPPARPVVPTREPAGPPTTANSHEEHRAATSRQPIPPSRTPTATGTTSGGPGSGGSPAAPVPSDGARDGTRPGNTEVLVQNTTRSDSDGFPWPPSLLLAGLLVAALLFATDRWRSVRGDRGRLRRPGPGAPR